MTVPAGDWQAFSQARNAANRQQRDVRVHPKAFAAKAWPGMQQHAGRVQ
jgi:hypothetical protein